MNKTQRITRFSDLDWASELKEIMIVGAGGIGSYTIFNLSRIGHELFIVDYDNVDEGNTIGGQLYRTKDISKLKTTAITEICREFGCINKINGFSEVFSKEIGMLDICITGLDNMSTRKEVFEVWKNHVKKSSNKDKCLLIDGRLTAELFEILAVQGDKEEQVEEYEKKYLFDDSEVEELSCTAKQTTYTAMGIASFMTAILCNWLTNRKLGMDFRETPLHTRIYYPAMLFGISVKEEEAIV